MVTQLEIAKRVGLDVSSVNKILNRVKGPVFREETVAQVIRVARDMGYNFNRVNKHSLQRRVDELETHLRLLVPEYLMDDSLAHKLGVAVEAVRQMKEMLYPKEPKRGRPKREVWSKIPGGAKAVPAASADLAAAENSQSR